MLRFFLQKPEQQQAERPERGCLRRRRRRAGAAANREQADRAAGTHVQGPERPQDPVSVTEPRSGCVWVCGGASSKSVFCLKVGTFPAGDD